MKTAILGWILSAGISVSVLGREIVVDLGGGGEFSEIQAAIDAAVDQDTVRVMPGEYVIREPISFQGKVITVEGSGAERTTIRMSENPLQPARASVVVFKRDDGQGAILSGFTLTGGGGTGRGLDGAYPSGAGVYFGGGSSPTLKSCTISGNRSTGVQCRRSSPALTNCVITGNGRGGVRCSGSLAAPRLRNCTISANTGIVGGSGVWCEFRSSPIISNCIIWSNPLGSFAFSDRSTPSVTYSCVQSAQVPDGEGNINIDPRFVREGVFDHSQGGPPVIVDPGDYRLQADSPCVDAGTSDNAPSTDIEAGGRPCGDGVDLGAFESGGCPPPTPFKRGDVNADGDRNMTDAVFVLDHLFGGGAEPPCSKSADVNDSGAVDLTDPVYLLNALFFGGPAPAAPFAGCGFDPTIDELTCESFAGCQ